MKAVVSTPFALLFLFSAAHGAVVLATYDFATSGTTNNALSASNTITPTANYTVSGFTGGAGLQGNVHDATFTITGFSTTGVGSSTNTRHMFVRVGGTDSTGPSDEAGAVAANDYYTFTVSPAAGFLVNLSSLNFDLAHGVSSSVFIRTSLDNFASTLYVNSSATTDTTLAAAAPLNFDSSFQNLTAPLEIRFYFADGSDSSTNTGLVSARLDNIVLSGDILAVPEPGPAALLGLAVLPFVRRRRRAGDGV